MMFEEITSDQVAGRRVYQWAKRLSFLPTPTPSDDQQSLVVPPSPHACPQNQPGSDPHSSRAVRVLPVSGTWTHHCQNSPWKTC